MRDGGRISAAIEVLDDFQSRRVPLKICLADWARGARYAGSKDRAFIAGLCLDVLRHWSRLLAEDAGHRGAVLLTLRERFNWSEDRIRAAFAEDPHGPGALSEAEEALFQGQNQQEPSPATKANLPEFTYPYFEAFSDDPMAEGLAYAERAPIDLRVNTLKSSPEKVMKALAAFGVEAMSFAKDGLRIPAPKAEDKAPAITSTPAFQKGWVEIQDEASQLAALAVGHVKSGQVLDFCAGGGGKTLALAALLQNKGQIHAYDVEARRLAPIFERLQRAGTRNVQVISPAEDPDGLEALKSKMDVVFVDSPCSGAGTWRRHPDTKWRLTEDQLKARIKEQNQVLGEASSYVKSGGRLVYVTCSPFPMENEERIEAFLTTHPDFQRLNARSAIIESGGLAEGAVLPATSGEGVMRFGPLKTGTDGFCVTCLSRQ